MNTRIYKIKAFTLTEMTVVIVISAIVVGLAFLILDIVQNSMRNIEGNYTYQSEIQSLEVALTIDFNSYSSANWDATKNTLLLSSPLQKKTYQFTTDSITNDIDSFKVSKKDMAFYFEGEKVDTGSVDAIKLTFDKTSVLHRIFVFKYNDPSIHY